MGFGVGNIKFPGLHVSGGSVQEASFNVHQTQNPQVDSTSPTISGDQYRSLVAAKDDAADFGDAVAAIGGSFQTWFLALTAAHREDVRESLTAIQG